MDKKKLLKITAVFFACMLCFTVLSRAADQMSVAVVSTSRPENRMITHEVRASGKIVQNQELAVTTEPNQRVKTLYVSEGDRVKKGDLLFEVDMTVLEEQILNQQQEMEKQNLTVSDTKSQKDVNAQQKASQQAQAAEQYSLSTHSAGVRLSRAEKALSEAKKELKKFRKKHQKDTSVQDSSVEASLEKACEEKAQAYIQAQQELSEAKKELKKFRKKHQKDTSVQDSSVEASLEKACEEKAQAYIQAQQELTEVQWKIENAVKTALQEAINAGTTASLVSNGAVLTGCALQEMPEIIVEEGSEGEESNASDGMEDAGGGYTGDIIIDESEVVGDGTADNGISGGDTQYESENIEDNGADGGTADNGTTGENGSIGGSGNTIIEGTDGSGEGNRTPTQEELDRIEQSVRSSYASELTAAQQKADNALLEKQEAEAALAQYQKERMDAESAQNKDSEKQLIANVKAAQQAYEDAAIAANEAAVTSGRAVQQAGIPDAQNSSDRMNEITYEQMELQLAKLEKLKEEGGRIKAPSDGLITKIQVITGEKTTDTTAMLMTDLSKGYRFTGEITKKQEEYIGTGDLVTLTGSSKKQVLEELPVESVTEDEENKSIRHITVQIPQESDVFALGAAATLSFSKKSEAYPICVPISALRLDEKNQTYVLVTEQYESVLGTETRARRVGVTVLEKNESYAALSEGGISSQQEVIISSAKAVDDGSRVRVQKQ